MNQRRGLGRGLGALIPSSPKPEAEAPEGTDAADLTGDERVLAGELAGRYFDLAEADEAEAEEPADISAAALRQAGECGLVGHAARETQHIVECFGIAGVGPHAATT